VGNILEDFLAWLRTFLWKISGRSNQNYALARAITHLLGGVLGGLIALLFSLFLNKAIVFGVVGGLLLSFLFWWETKNQMDGQDRLKTLTDLGAWFTGFLLVVLFS